MYNAIYYLYGQNVVDVHVLFILYTKFLPRGFSDGKLIFSLRKGCCEWAEPCYLKKIFFYFIHFVVPMGISPMGNLGLFPQGMPAATELHYPTLTN